MTDDIEDRRRPQMSLVPVLTKRELMDATKEAVKELLTEQVTAFGWFSLKTIVLAGLSAGFVAWLYLKGWHRG